MTIEEAVEELRVTNKPFSSMIAAWLSLSKDMSTLVNAILVIDDLENKIRELEENKS